MRYALVAASLALAGCSAEAPQPPAPSPSTSTPTADSSSAKVAASSPAVATQTPAPLAAEVPASLVGEWRVAGIDGQPLDAPIGIALSIRAQTITFEPTCAGFVWQYRYEDGRLETDRPIKSAARTPGATPPPVCAVAVHSQQRALSRALDAVTAARRTEGNGVELSGGGHSVVLFGQ